MHLPKQFHKNRCFACRISQCAERTQEKPPVNPPQILEPNCYLICFVYTRMRNVEKQFLQICAGPDKNDRKTRVAEPAKCPLPQRHAVRYR